MLPTHLLAQAQRHAPVARHQICRQPSPHPSSPRRPYPPILRNSLQRLAVRLLPRSQSHEMEGLRLAVPALTAQADAQVMGGDGHIGMGRAKGGGAAGEGRAVELLCLLVLSQPAWYMGW